MNMLRIINTINLAFKKHPLITNSLVYGGLYVGAEYSQQFFTKKIMVKKSATVATTTTTATTPVTIPDASTAASATTATTTTTTIITSKTKNDVYDERGIDYPTLGRYAVMGTFIYAPTLYTWYKWLDGKYPGTNRQIIFKKLFLDQFILTPYLLIVFYTGMAIMEGAENKFKELFEKFVPTFQRSCLFWLPVQFCNFTLILPKYRVIYMGVCGFIWINILCWTKREEIAK